MHSDEKSQMRGRAWPDIPLVRQRHACGCECAHRWCDHHAVRHRRADASAGVRPLVCPGKRDLARWQGYSLASTLSHRRQVLRKLAWPPLSRWESRPAAYGNKNKNVKTKIRMSKCSWNFNSWYFKADLLTLDILLTQLLVARCTWWCHELPFDIIVHCLKDEGTKSLCAFRNVILW
jgi:hypothetical protein